MQAMLTVDVERDWGTQGTRGIHEALPWLLDLLARRGAQATFFVVGDLCAEVRKELDPRGEHEVASHGLTHRVLARLAVADVAHEVAESKRRLEAEGYRVLGFRAPFFTTTRELPELLVRAGYRYDASRGSVYPSLRNRGPAVAPCAEAPALTRVGASTLRDGLTPFNLTWLRLLDPLGLRLVGARPQHFQLHLHELLDGDGGWAPWPRPLRRLHARRVGAGARRIVDAVLTRFEGKLVSCRTFIDAGGVASIAT